jgi:hypothetical protein
MSERRKPKQRPDVHLIGFWTFKSKIQQNRAKQRLYRSIWRDITSFQRRELATSWTRSVFANDGSVSAKPGGSTTI